MVVRNLGYGNDGRGGPGGDAAPISKPNPNDSRGQSPQSSPPTIPAKLPITNFTVVSDDDFSVAQFVFQGQFDEFVIGHAITETGGVEVESGSNVTIAKPPQFRKSVVDTGGVEVNGEIVTYAPDETGKLQGTRKREFESNGTVITVIEKIDPPYFSGDRCYVAESQTTGISGISLIDINVQARRWKDIELDHKYFQITDVNRDTYTCQEWDFETNAQKLNAQSVLLDAVEVAKPHDLRGSTWDFTLNGSTLIEGKQYDVDGGTAETDSFNARNGLDEAPNPDETEDQEVLPRWLVDVTIIRAAYIPNGTGAQLAGVQSVWQDTNDGGRAFAEKFVAA